MADAPVLESVSHGVVSPRGIWGDIGVPVDQVGGHLPGKIREHLYWVSSKDTQPAAAGSEVAVEGREMGGELVGTVIAGQVPEGWVDHEEGRDLVMVHVRPRPSRIVRQPQVPPEPDDPFALHLLARLGGMGKNPLVRRM
jgi:hypothetical protein